MSRTNTAAYESIKASQIVFQNPDRTFPEPGAVLAIDNLRGATTWSRNLDVDSMTLSGSSSSGILTYDNQLLVNGNPVSSSGLGSGYNITIAGGTVNMDIQHDVSMNRNSIQDCSSITIVGQYGTPGTFRSIGTDILLNKPLMISSSPYGRLILKGTGVKQASLTYAEGTDILTTVSPAYEFKTSAGGDNIIAIDASSQLYLDVSAGSSANVLGYDVATGAVRYQAAGGGSDISGGYNITVESGAVNMNITQPVLMNNNPIVNASYVDISAGGGSGKLSYLPGPTSFLSSANFTINGPINPKITLIDTTTLNYGIIQYENAIKKTSINGENVAMIADYGSQEITDSGPTLTSYNNRIWWNVYDPPNGVMKSSLELSTENTLIIGNTDISLNPVLLFQGGKAVNSQINTTANVEYFDASGVEQLRFTSKNYAFNAVPAGSLPHVLGYDTATGEIKHQALTGGLSPLTTFTYDSSGLLTPAGGVSLGTFTAPASGIYSINFVITLANDSSTFIQFDNLSDSFDLIYAKSSPPPSFFYPLLKISGIQTRPPSSLQTAAYSTTVLESLTSGTSYLFGASNENASGTCTWASCIAEVRIIRLC